MMDLPSDDDDDDDDDVRLGTKTKEQKLGEQSVLLVLLENTGTQHATMPTLNISTNVPLDGISTSDILKDASKAVARTIGKPEQYVMVLLRGGVPMSFAGTEEPAAYAEVVSIGGLGPSVNKSISAAVADILESKLSVPKSRFYLKFTDVKGSDMGWKGSTF